MITLLIHIACKQCSDDVLKCVLANMMSLFECYHSVGGASSPSPDGFVSRLQSVISECTSAGSTSINGRPRARPQRQP